MKLETDVSRSLQQQAALQAARDRIVDAALEYRDALSGLPHPGETLGELRNAVVWAADVYRELEASKP